MLAAQPIFARRTWVLPAIEVDDAPRQHRHDKGGHQVGDGECRRHRDGQRLGESAGDAAEKAQRHEHDQCCQAGPGQRLHELPARGQHRSFPGRRAVRPGRARAAGDMLDHNDHVVDQQADRGGDAAQGHDVEAHAKQAQHQDGSGQRRRDGQDSDQRHAPTAQEQDQHGPRQHEADQHRVPHAAGRTSDQLALVVPVHQPNPGRQLEPGELVAHRGRYLHGIAVRLLIDVEQHRRAAVLDDPGPLRRHPVLHAGHVAHADDPGRVGAHNGVADLGGSGDAVVGYDEVELVAVLQAADRLEHIACPERGDEIAQADAVGGKAMRIGQHLHLGRLAALHVHAGETLDGGEQRNDLILGEVAQRDG